MFPTNTDCHLVLWDSMRKKKVGQRSPGYPHIPMYSWKLRYFYLENKAGYRCQVCDHAFCIWQSNLISQNDDLDVQRMAIFWRLSHPKFMVDFPMRRDRHKRKAFSLCDAVEFVRRWRPAETTKPGCWILSPVKREKGSHTQIGQDGNRKIQWL